MNNISTAKAVETFQVINDNSSEATGTAERLLEGLESPSAAPGEKATSLQSDRAHFTDLPSAGDVPRSPWPP